MRPKAKGDFLRDLGIPERTARHYMELAGYTEEISPASGNDGETHVPTYAEAGIDRRERTKEPAPAPSQGASRGLTPTAVHDNPVPPSALPH